MIYNRYQHATIELCHDCKGEGLRAFYEPYDILQMNPEIKTCPTCEGSGRVVVSKKIEITVIPFKNK